MSIVEHSNPGSLVCITILAKNKSPFGELSKPNGVLIYSALIHAVASEVKSSTLLIKGLPETTAWRHVLKMELNVADPRDIKECVEDTILHHEMDKGGIKVQFVDEFRAEIFRGNFHGEVRMEQFAHDIKFIENMVVPNVLSGEDDDGDDYDVI
ncbi:hypothetical protein N0V94_006500 [Neodidymelliopsis sp. IMI 364377]|nr:hypothetical protein N0V94_006500 [Neodidymelliopsis sp. IMI 364377]